LEDAGETQKTVFMSAQRTAKTLVYIASTNRSGSTLLGSLLSVHSGVSMVGELHSLHSYLNQGVYGRIYDYRCSCRKKVANCPFWRKVIDGAGLTDQTALTRVRSGTSSVRRNLAYPLHCVAGENWIVEDLRRELAQSVNAWEAAQTCYRIFDQACETSGHRLVVDTSKRVDQALALIHFKPSNWAIRVVHLLRDPRGNADSLVRRARENGAKGSFSGACLYWVRENRRLQVLGRQLGPERYFRLRCEDLCAKPEQHLQAICSFIGIDYEPRMLEGNPVALHDIGGSPRKLDYNQGIQIRLDERWRDSMTLRRKLAYAVIARRLARQFGYR
jgi:hypothetical protein